MFGCESSEQRAISRQADWDIPVYWIVSPSLSGLNLYAIGQHALISSYRSNDQLLDSEFARLSIMANSLVDPSVRAATDKSNDLVSVQDLHFACITIVR